MTRQNAGTVLKTAAAPALFWFGGVNAPACTGWAESTEPFDSSSWPSDSHAIGAAAATRAAKTTAMAISAGILMSAPIGGEPDYTHGR